jgi:hypothetical protein
MADLLDPGVTYLHVWLSAESPAERGSVTRGQPLRPAPCYPGIEETLPGDRA